MRRALFPAWFAVLLLCAASLFSSFARADDALDARELQLAHQLRCLVCQNQTLAESNAPLAADMRRQIREQLAQGRSDDEIVAFFEKRYGAFVRFDPPFVPSTWALWIAPFALLGLGFVALWRGMSRRRAQAPVAELDDAERARIARLLDEDEEPPR